MRQFSRCLIDVRLVGEVAAHLDPEEWHERGHLHRGFLFADGDTSGTDTQGLRPALAQLQGTAHEASDVQNIVHMNFDQLTGTF